MKLPDKRLIFFQFPCIALGFQITPEFKFQDERLAVKYAIVQIANESDLMFINRLAHLCDVTI